MKKLNHHVLMPSSRDRGVTRGAMRRSASAIPSMAVNAARSALYAVFGAAGDVGGDMIGDVAVQRVARCERDAGKRLVERGDVEVVGGVGHGLGEERVELGSPSRLVVSRRELVPARRRALGMRDEQLVVVRPADLLGDDGQHVREEVEWFGAREQRGDRGVVEEVGERRERCEQSVRQLRSVGHAAARADVQHRLEPARLVRERAVGSLDEATAAALGHQGDEVGERLAEAERPARRRRE